MKGKFGFQLKTFPVVVASFRFDRCLSWVGTAPPGIPIPTLRSMGFPLISFGNVFTVCGATFLCRVSFDKTSCSPVFPSYFMNGRTQTSTMRM
jgi:hypothetical protein